MAVSRRPHPANTAWRAAAIRMYFLFATYTLHPAHAVAHILWYRQVGDMVWTYSLQCTDLGRQGRYTALSAYLTSFKPPPCTTVSRHLPI